MLLVPSLGTDRYWLLDLEYCAFPDIVNINIRTHQHRLDVDDNYVSKLVFTFVLRGNEEMCRS